MYHTSRPYEAALKMILNQLMWQPDLAPVTCQASHYWLSIRSSRHAHTCCGAHYSSLYWAARAKEHQER